jgi:hypothetical protein
LILAKSKGKGVGLGGMGSGNWWRWQGKKDAVEDSLVIGMKDLRKRLFTGRGWYAYLDLGERRQVEHRLYRQGLPGMADRPPALPLA